MSIRSGPNPRRARTSYRDAFCNELGVGPVSADAPLNTRGFLSPGFVAPKRRETEAELDSANPIRGLFTRTTYMEDYCTPHMDTNPLKVTARGERTCAMTTEALARSLPKNESPRPPETPAVRARPATTATNFWTRTTYRDAYGNVFANCTGPINFSADEFAARSYFLGKSSETATRGGFRYGVEDRKPRTIERPLTGIEPHAKTTYRDAYGIPFPITAPLALAASGTLTGTQGGPGEYWQITSSGVPRAMNPRDPRWPVGTAGNF
jgi:hypothetical protein